MRALITTTFTFVVCALTITPVSFAQNSFSEWRGKDGVGHADAKNLPVKWNATTGIAWAAPVEGLGWSTPIVGDGKVWITSGIQTPASAEEQARRRKLTTNSQPLIISKHVSLRAICFDLATGKELHNIEVLAVDDPQIIHRTNSYATPTPILEGEMLYCHFGALGMIGLNTKSLQVVWSNTNLSVKLENGPGSSPVLWNNLLILHCDGIDQQYIVALDKKTG
ncbi:MAG: serine/threonine protein kinase, partial [Planctomycetota bacterium]|nr:serine/threonine protein kinase [Planctomycetota bacterium]